MQHNILTVLCAREYSVYQVLIIFLHECKSAITPSHSLFSLPLIYLWEINGITDTTLNNFMLHFNLETNIKGGCAYPCRKIAESTQTHSSPGNHLFYYHGESCERKDAHGGHLDQLFTCFQVCAHCLCPFHLKAKTHCNLKFRAMQKCSV